MIPDPPQLSIEEMRDLVSYLWAGEFFRDSGSPSVGERLFTSKHCASCHNDASSGARVLTGTGQSFTGATMVSALWHHGPHMLDQMKGKGIAWPQFDAQEVSDVIAYLNAKNGGK